MAAKGAFKAASIIASLFTGVYEKWADDLNEQGDLAYDAENYQSAVDIYSKAFVLIEKTDNKRKIKKYRKTRDKAIKKLI